MKVHVIDDYPESRNSFVELFEAEDLPAEPVIHPSPTIKKMLDDLASDSFLFSDYHLKKHSYANYDGDLVISQAYKNKISGLLCSGFSDIDSTLGRSIRRYIPMIVEAKDVKDAELIYRCREISIDEFKGEFSEVRKPWRALCRVAEYDKDSRKVYFVIPGWDSKTKISAPLSDFQEINTKNIKEEGFRFYCKVNMGCENPKDLYITEVESVDA